MKTVRIAARTKVNAAAGAIAGFLREENDVKVCAIGTKAINQMVKALALATEFMEGDGCDLRMYPKFRKVDFVNTEGVGTSIEFILIKGEPVDEAWKETDEKTEAADKEVAPESR